MKKGETIIITPIVVIIGRIHPNKLYIELGSDASNVSKSLENLFKILPIFLILINNK